MIGKSASVPSDPWQLVVHQRSGEVCDRADVGPFAATPKVRAWRLALAQRPSVAGAADLDYADRLRAFLTRHVEGDA